MRVKAPTYTHTPTHLHLHLMKLSLLLLCLTLAAGAVARAGNNVLLIIADDYGIDSSSLYNSTAGATLPPTPNINALASNGVRFTNAYANPVCSPSRACLIRAGMVSAPASARR